MAKAPPNLTLISSHVSAANLDALMQMKNGLRKSDCTGVLATSLNVMEAAQAKDPRIILWFTES